MKTNSNHIKMILVIFLPIILATSIIILSSPQKVSGINFKLDLSTSINRSRLPEMKEILDENGWKTEYPTKFPFGSEDNLDTIFIDMGCSKMYLVGGNDSYFYGIWCYKINMFTGEGWNVETEKEKILEKIDEVSALLSLNYSKASLVIDDNDFELLPFQLEYFLYSLCAAYTISSFSLYLWKGEDIWKRILVDWEIFIGFALLNLSLLPIWPLIQTIRFGLAGSLDNPCYVCLLFSVVFFLISLLLLSSNKEKGGENKK